MQRASFDDDGDDKPLDPAAEKVRKRLVRFVAINLGILFFAVMAVLGAVVYKSGVVGDGEVTEPWPSDAPFVEASIALPAGANIVSHALSGNRLSLDVELAGGDRAIFLYDTGERRMLGRYSIEAE